MTYVIIYALVMNWLFMLPGYGSTLARFNMYRAPFNCLYCITFWFALIAYALTPPAALTLTTVMVAAASSYLAIFINKVFTYMPTTF